jgi:hypothetical protein
LSAAERRILLAAARAWAVKAMRSFGVLSTYYSSNLHNVYLRWKHGYTLVDPRASEIRVAHGPSARPQDLFRNSFAVMHEQRDGQRILQVVYSDGDALLTCVNRALDAVALLHSLAMVWVMELEQEEHRTVALGDMPVDLMAKWMGADFTARWGGTQAWQDAVGLRSGHVIVSEPNAEVDDAAGLI